MKKTNGNVPKGDQYVSSVSQGIPTGDVNDDDDDGTGEEVHENCVSVHSTDLIVSGVNLIDESHDPSF